MSSLIFTVAQNGYATAFLPCIASQRAYAKRIGADYVAVTKPRRLPEVPLSAWLKIPLMIRGLKTYDWVMFLDADCEIRPGAPDVAEFLAGVEGDVFMAIGKSGRVNSGVMVARRSATSLEFFERVLASLTEVISDADRANLKYENGNVIYVNRTHGGVTPLDGRWNNTSDPDLKDFVRHYTGNLRETLQRSPWRELQFRLLKRLNSRPLFGGAKQPVARDVGFRDALSDLERTVVADYPSLTASGRR